MKNHNDNNNSGSHDIGPNFYVLRLSNPAQERWIVAINVNRRTDQGGRHP